MFHRVALLFLVGFVSFLTACATLSKVEAPAIEAHRCIVAALEPLAGSYERAERLFSEVQAERLNMREFLELVNASDAQAKTLEDALSACHEQFKAAVVGASK